MINRIIIFISLFLTACGSIPTSTPTSAPSSTATKLQSTRTPIPTATIWSYPFEVPTPINTPHAFPTPIGQVSQNGSFELIDERTKDFENSLEFSIEIIDVNYFENDGYSIGYLVKANAELRNISQDPIVINIDFIDEKPPINPELFWSYYYNGVEIGTIKWRGDIIGQYYPKPEDFIVLHPQEFQRFSWAFYVPKYFQNINGQELDLEGKTITFIAYYSNADIGYSAVDNEGHLYTTEDSNGNNVHFEIDMNAWIGLIESNSTEFTFP